MDWERCEAGQGADLLHQKAWEGFLSVSVGSGTLLLFQQVVLYIVNLYTVVLYIASPVVYLE